MCLAIPAQIVECLPDQAAIVTIGGVRKHISLALLPCEVKVGDFVIVHVGFALNKLDETAARQTLKDFEAMLTEPFLN